MHQLVKFTLEDFLQYRNRNTAKGKNRTGKQQSRNLLAARFDGYMWAAFLEGHSSWDVHHPLRARKREQKRYRRL